MVLTTVDTACRTWRLPQCPFPMECSGAVLEQIHREVEQARNAYREARETGGVLFGIPYYCSGYPKIACPRVYYTRSGSSAFSW
jgi:hypothetical protein